ncbi:MAG: hypothetical protein H6509_05645 [Bryobacterales bacterium]|nr:hypothetical protein [Acidobacteriota bacterium]MCB9384077.1 hypothetical protein [Bryobacterales bacterium]
MDQLFASYRDAIPELEPSPEFLSNVWRRIEERRGFVWTSLLRRWAPRVAAVSALATVLLTASVWIPQQQQQAHEEAVLDRGYIEALTVGSLDEHDGALWIMAGDRLATRR